MTLNLSTCFVLVDDPDAALLFYRNTLGLQVRMDVNRENLRWITVGTEAQPDVGLVLTNYLNEGPVTREVLAELSAKGVPNGVQFSTDDVDEMFAMVQKAGADIEQEPTDQPWGVRDFALRDPAGNLLRINQARAVHSA